MDLFRLWREKQPRCVYEEIEKRQRQTGLKEFMARRGVNWTPGVNAGNNRNSRRDQDVKEGSKRASKIAGQIRNHVRI
ncbi:uncharacterized protein LOC128549170 isoform X2 [Mercenaria mercenaria]|uniref:uncharacterized protein LOC128549170 isoform X2 n=1 Tax=Mercenaria mercenaria TaxID=6596 RepID=UPI00234EB1B5|nr:uncharacterized protein LOC128549170 isoform X2 [Mercenaria mercenaria]